MLVLCIQRLYIKHSQNIIETNIVNFPQWKFHIFETVISLSFFAETFS